MKKRNNGTHKIITLLCFTIHHDGNKMYCETKQIPVYDPLQETRKKKKKKKEEGKKKESFHIVH